MDDTSERLVRVETKLDALIQLNDQRIQHIENKVLEVERAAADRTRHEKANYDQKLNALQVQIEKKASNDDFKLVRTVVFGFVGLVLTAVASALIASVVLKPHTAAVKVVASVSQLAPGNF